jgi:hypothetical protein
MVEGCVECGVKVQSRSCASHWLCCAHRASVASALVASAGGRALTEAEMLRALVFDFPEACGDDEFLARAHYVSEVWTSRSQLADIEGVYGVPLLVARDLTRSEMQGLVCSFVEFVCRHAHVASWLNAACADRVRAWYPALICSETTASLLRGERMLYALERVTGTREFLVLADLAVALQRKLNRDAVELIYAQYARGVSSFEGLRVEWF